MENLEHKKMVELSIEQLKMIQDIFKEKNREELKEIKKIKKEQEKSKNPRDNRIHRMNQQKSYMLNRAKRLAYKKAYYQKNKERFDLEAKVRYHLKRNQKLRDASEGLKGAIVEDCREKMIETK